MSEPDENSTSIYFKASFFLLLAGFLFALGQAIALSSFAYLTTFSYVDFLINSILIIPFVLVIFFTISVVSDYIFKPCLLSYKTFIAVKNKKNVINSISRLIQAIGIPVIIVLTFMYPSKFPYVAILAIILGLSLKAIIKRTDEEPTSRESNNNTEEIKASIKSIASIDYSWLVFTGLALVLFGTLYIELQRKEIPDSELTIKEESEVIKVNILTSNSNYIVAYRDGRIEIVPRSEIKIISHKSIYLDFKPFNKLQPKITPLNW